VKAAVGHDLLVVGTHGGSRAEGMFVGRTATAVLHRARCPTLIVRESAGFPDSILFADDGKAWSAEAGRLTAAIASRFSATVTIATPKRLDRDERDARASRASQILAATGHEALRVDLQGRPVRGIPAAVREAGSSLLILGSRGLRGLRARSSVSERVAHDAPCSVLVVRA
jgi:nucleotide-binding universal stress UspA family protein